MTISRDMLLGELKELQRLTAFEQTIATVRRAQAASTPIAQELAGNAAKSAERLALLAQAVRGIGGAPDVVGPVLGRLTAFVQTQVNQVQTLQGALLGDLALEHQLRERARYARTLAVSLGETSVVPVLDRLDGAHTETIAWLERRLAEVGRTGTSAIRATPVQLAVGSVRRVAATPFTLAVDGVNRLGGVVQRFTRAAPAKASAAASSAADVAQDAASTVASTAGSVVGSAEDLASRAVDAASETADEAAQTVAAAADRTADTVSRVAGSAAGTVAGAASTVSDAAGSAAEAVSGAADEAAVSVSGAAAETADVVADAGDRVVDLTDRAASAAATADNTATTTTGTTATTGPATTEAAEAAAATQDALAVSGGTDVADEKAPFAGYERLTGDSIMRHVEDTEDVEELRTLLAFEQAHKARKGVLKAVQGRLTDLSTSV